MKRVGLMLLAGGWLLFVVTTGAQSVLLSDDFESPDLTVDASRWPGSAATLIESVQPVFGNSNRCLKISGPSVKMLSGNWSSELTGRTCTLAFDYFEAAGSGTDLILGYAAGTSDLNAAGAFVRIALNGGVAALAGTEGTSMLETGTLTYPQSVRLTFSLVLNNQTTPQPFNGNFIPGRCLEVWFWDWSSWRAVFVMRVSTEASIRMPAAVGFRTWSTSTQVLAYVDNVKLVNAPVLVTDSVPAVPPPVEKIRPLRPFVHPSVFNSQEELDRIKYRIGHEPGAVVQSGWNMMRAASVASLGYTSLPCSNVVVMGSGTTPTEDQFRNDSQAARAAALQWVATGDARYRDKALGILNGWANTFVTMSPAAGTSTAQIQLEAAWAAPVWVSAADIIRYYDRGAGGWSPAQIARFDQMVDYLYLQAAKAASMNQNWGASAALTMISVGAYQEDRARFDAGIRAWQNGLVSINSAVGYNGYINEVCRDTIHPQYTLQVWMQAAEIAWKHGIDLFGTKLAGSNAPQFAINLENFSRLFLGLAQPPCSASFLTNYNYVGEQGHSGAYDIAYNHYIHRLGLTSLPTYSSMITNGWRPGGWDGHFGSWSTLTHGNLSMGLPAVQSLAVSNLISSTNNGLLEDGDTLNLRDFQDHACRIAALGGSNLSSVQFYTNGVAFGMADTEAPFLSGELAPGNYFLTAVPWRDASGGAFPGDPVTVFLRVVDFPSDWSLWDIGGPLMPAWARASVSNLVLAAAGTNLSGTVDQLGFLAVEATNDLQLTARLQATSGPAGLMIRENHAPGSRQAFLFLDPAAGRLVFQCRAVDNGAITSVAATTAINQPWLRLLRLGRQLTAYVSADSQSWQRLGSTELTMGGNTLAGFVSISPTSEACAAAHFESWSFAPLNPDFAEWQKWALILRCATNGIAQGAAADPDADTRSNQWEFRLGSDPLAPDAQPAVEAGAMDGSFVRLRLLERANAAAFGRSCLLSTNLSTWRAVSPLGESVIKDSGSLVVRELIFPAIEPASFYRISYQN